MNYLRWTRVLSSMVGLAALSCAPPQSETETTNLGSSSTSSSTSTTAGCEAGSPGCPCADEEACADGLVCVGGVCEADDGTTTEATTTTTGATTEATTTTGDDASTTSTYDGTCDLRDGLKNPACTQPELPYCSLTGLCSDCSALVSCATINPDESVCDLESGLCVQCNAEQAGACSGTTPLCDLATKSCVGCSEHGQCASGACDVDTGACFPEGAVLHVFRDSQQNGKCTSSIGNGGTKDKPYCSAQEAVSHVAMIDPETPTVIHLLPGAPQPHLSLDVASAGPHLTLALVADENPTPAPEFVGATANIRAKGEVTLYLANFDVESTGMSDTPKLECVDGARLYADRVRVHGGAGPGVRGTGCDHLSLSNAAVFKNGSEGIEMTYGVLVLRNTFVSDNGVNDAYGGGGLRVDQAVIDIAYSTFFLNHSLYSLGDSIHCAGKALDGSIVRNSIIGRSEVIKTNESIVCLDLKVTYSVVDGGEMQGPGNLKRTVPEINALLKGDYPIGAYRLKGEAEAAMIGGVGLWKTGDPTGDFEGDPRMAVHNGEVIPGADVFAP